VPRYIHREAGGQNEVKFIIIIIVFITIIVLLLYYVQACTRQQIKGCGQEKLRQIK